MVTDSKYYQLQLSKYIKKLRRQKWLGIIYQNINNKDQTICLKEGILPRLNQKLNIFDIYYKGDMNVIPLMLYSKNQTFFHVFIQHEFIK